MSTATIAGHPERLAAPLGRYLTALVVRSARVAEVPVSEYCARVEAVCDGADLEAFRAIAVEASVQRERT
jgi:hypothetical protein